jgi:hypothetical protein
MKGLAPSQIALLNYLYAQAGSSTIPGTWLIAGTVTLDKINLASFDGRYALLTSFTGLSNTVTSTISDLAALTTRVTNVEPLAANGQTAFGWGNHASVGYVMPTDDWTWTVNGVMASTLTTQAANGDTAYGWGDHSVAGYITAMQAPILVVEEFTVGAGQGQVGDTFTVAGTPAIDTAVQVWQNGTKVTNANVDWDGTDTLTIDTTDGDVIEIYYSGRP